MRPDRGTAARRGWRASLLQRGRPARRVQPVQAGLPQPAARRPDAGCRLPGGGRRRGTRPRRRRLPTEDQLPPRIPPPLRFRRGGGRVPTSLPDALGPYRVRPTPGPLSSQPPRPHTPHPPTHRAALLTAAAPGLLHPRRPRPRPVAGEPSASAAAASSGRRRARADQTDWRTAGRAPHGERARSRRSARGARGPEEGEGRWLGGGGAAARDQCARPGGGASLGAAHHSRCAWPAPASGRAQSWGSDGGAGTWLQGVQQEPRGPRLPRRGRRLASFPLFGHSSSRGALSPPPCCLRASSCRIST